MCGNIHYLEPLKKATGRFFAQGHLPAALKKIPQTIKQIHLGETPPDIISEDDEGDLLKLDSTEKAHLVMVSLFRSHLPSPVGSMEMAGPPDQNVQAGYIRSW